MTPDDRRRLRPLEAATTQAARYRAKGARVTAQRLSRPVGSQSACVWRLKRTYAAPFAIYAPLLPTSWPSHTGWIGADAPWAPTVLAMPDVQPDVLWASSAPRRAMTTTPTCTAVRIKR